MNKKELLSYVIIIIAIIIIRVYIMTPALVNHSSMEPTLLNQELILLNKFSYLFFDVKRFDIIVVNVNSYGPLVKRVIGLPGETIEYKKNKLYINGTLLEEPCLQTITNDYVADPIPLNHYFLLGDNRNNSIDSRSFGVVAKDDIIGKVNFILYPLSRLAKVK